MLARTLDVQVPLGRHHNSSRRRRTLNLLSQVQSRVQRERARTLKVQMPLQKNVVLGSKSHVQRTFKIVSLGSCHKGERSWQSVYV
jgi:hypothetical protein